MTFEFTGPDSVRIGARTLRVRVQDAPMKDGTTHHVEATSNPTAKFQEKLCPAELAGLKAESIPYGFQLTIYQPEARATGLDFLAIDNIRHGHRMLIALSFYFSDWSRRTSLVDFAEVFRALIEQKVAACRDVRLEKDEYGVSLWISLSMNPGDDFYERFTEAESAIMDLYKQALAKADDKLQSLASPADSGFRWWLRYVIVPIVSGGTGAALVVWLLSHA
jgi:hypothetical protein